MSKSCLFAILVLLALFTAAPTAVPAEPAASSPPILGTLYFPTSGAPAAQPAFERGVMLLHSFEYEDARSAFLEAQAADPGFAMAIWGEAMTLNHPLWDQQNREEALDVLAKLPPPGTRDTTPLEERFIAAVQTLYGDGSKQARDLAYRDALAAMHADYPDDLEVAAFYALSILGSVYERDVRTYMQAAAVAEEVFAKEPNHPGAAHYLIHSYDDQVHAPLGLRAARAYKDIAPSAAHAQHMVSHIYTSLGRWDDVVEANRTAVRVSEESNVRAGRSKHLRSKHSLHWLEYALLQQGRYDEAADTLAIMREDVTALPDLPNVSHSALMRASFAAEQPLAENLLAPLDDVIGAPPNGAKALPLYYRALDDFATSWILIANGKLEDARDVHARLTQQIASARVLSVAEGLHEDDTATSADEYLLSTIIAREIEALLDFHAGDIDRALSLLDEAITDELGRPAYYGPPHVPKPSDELKGEMLLALGRHEEAAALFEQVLGRHTNRTLALVGLANATEAAGDGKVAETWSRLEHQWRGALAEVRAVPYSWLPAGATSENSPRYRE
jgi:tetratricopeptide (TPR) repeat protein